MSARASSIVASTLALAALLPARPARAAPAPPEIYAVVVGWNGGTRELPDLRYADDDAVRLSLFFAGMTAAPAGGKVWLLTELDDDTRRNLAAAGLSAKVEAAPTRRAVLAALAAVAAELRQRPRRGPRLLYFVYAGHGLRGRLLLRPEQASEAALTGDELRAALADVVAADPAVRPFLFIDACRSQSLFAERGGDDSGPDFGPAIGELERRAQGVPIGILTAARAGKPAGEVRALEAGYFSHVLASGLAGAADADGDEVVTFGELAAFVAFNTERLTGQQPYFDPPGGDLGARAIDHRGRRPRLLLSSQEAGRYVVGAGPGLPVFAEAFKDQARPLRLALPPGRYRVTRVLDRQHARAATIELRAGESVDLQGAAWADVAPPAGASRGEGAGDPEGLGFSEPFSSGVVSTLTAGYHAGREPSSPGAGAPNALSIGAGLGPAPLGLGGAETRLALRFRRGLGRLLVGAELRAGTSEHRHGQPDAFDLRRVGLLLAAGPSWRPHRLLALHILAEAGAQATLQVAGDRTTGDLFGPVLDAAAGAALALSGPFFAAAEARYDLHWVKIDGAREHTAGLAAELGLGVRF
jgi:hypothetical protein